jgi:hypothetical protein
MRYSFWIWFYAHVKGGQGFADGSGCFALGSVSQQSWSLAPAAGTFPQTITVSFTGGQDGRCVLPSHYESNEKGSSVDCHLRRQCDYSHVCSSWRDRPRHPHLCTSWMLISISFSRRSTSRRVLPTLQDASQSLLLLLLLLPLLQHAHLHQRPRHGPNPAAAVWACDRPSTPCPRRVQSVAA